MNTRRSLGRVLATMIGLCLFAACAGAAAPAASTPSPTGATASVGSPAPHPTVPHETGAIVETTGPASDVELTYTPVVPHPLEPEEPVGEIVESTEVAVAHGQLSFRGNTITAAAHRISSSGELDDYLAALGNPSVLTQDEIAQARDALARGRILVGAIFFTGCFAAGGPVIVQDQGSARMVATFTNKQEGQVDCAVAVQTLGLVSVDAGQAWLSALPSIGQVDMPTSQPSTPEPTDITDASAPVEPALPSTEIAVTSGTPHGGTWEGRQGPYLISSQDDLTRFSSLYQDAVGAQMFSPAQISAAAAALKQGKVLVGATIHSGCFAAGKPVLAYDEGKLRLVATETDPRESTVMCFVAISTMAIVAVDPADLPSGVIPAVP